MGDSTEAGNSHEVGGSDARGGAGRNRRAVEPEAIVLSDADRALLRHKATRGLMRALAAQAILGLAAGVVSWLVS